MHESKSHDLNKAQHSPCQRPFAPVCWARAFPDAVSYNRQPHYLTLFVTCTGRVWRCHLTRL